MKFLNLYSNLAATANDSSIGLIVVVFVVLAAIGSRIFKKAARPNQCPKCRKESLEAASHWWHGKYNRCRHTWLCGWSEIKQKKKQQQATREREREYAKEAFRRNQIQEQERYRQVVIDKIERDRQIERERNH